MGRGDGPGPESGADAIEVTRAVGFELHEPGLLLVTAKAHGAGHNALGLLGHGPIKVGGELTLLGRPLLGAFHEDEPTLGLNVLVQEARPAKLLVQEGCPILDQRVIRDAQGLRVRKIGGPYGPLGG